MADAITGSIGLTVPVKRGTRNQLDGEKKELLDLLRASDDVPDDYHPLVELARLANSQRLPINLKMRAHAEIAQYTTPKLQTVKQKIEGGDSVPELRLVRITRTPEEHKRIEHPPEDDE